ncbi:hypothetical protein [Deinococcus aetherius]|uniref:hypothetical protein n=1 Tax=Deinococcus aetherius TaxID=200252 RepID=UPI0022301BE3|nr:hypothetical protein [Deinococcus aetherius]
MNKGLTLLALLTPGFAGAQFSGPSESHVPRAAEADAIIRAVCSSGTKLGRLTGCRQVVYEGRPSPEILGPQTRLTLSTVRSGSFTAANQKELLATFCTETESCSGETVLLRHTRGQWQAVGLVPDFLPGTCLTYPKPGGAQAAVCLSENARNEPIGSALKIASWTGGKLKVETVALFPLLAFRDWFKPRSAQCAGRWQLDPFSWDDRDRNADRVPDLTILASRTTYQGGSELCKGGMAFNAQASGSVRNDLTFVWTGETLRPTGNTAAIRDKYARGQ